MEEEMIYRPRQMYMTQLKQQFHDASAQYFEKLLRESQVDENMNASHVKDYKAKVEERKAKESALGRTKTGKVFAIIGLVLFSIVAVLFLILTIANVVGPWGWGVFAGGLALAVLMIILLATRIKNAMKYAKEALEKAKEVEEKALQVCYADLAPLNALYDWNMPQKIMNRVTPILKLDEHYTSSRDDELHRIYGLKDDDASTLQVLSGSILDNPFILERVYERDIHDKEYTGEITITWTTTSRDSNGHTVTHHHSQVLHASVYHPAPFFYKTTRIIYGNEAAPDLSFTRSPNKNSALEGKALDHYIKKRSKQLSKKEREALTDNDPTTNFKTMGNETFDALFGADDRDNEVQFRLLFTALAQTNMLDLLKNKEPFGDDFVFCKDHKINSIASAHSQDFNYVANPEHFKGYDVKACREFFVSYCDKFLTGLYFDLAPLISIPAYQTHRPAHSFLDKDAATWLPRREHEVAANKLGDKLFLPKDADPNVPLFLKETSCVKGDGVDDSIIHSSGFHTTPKTDYVSKMGNDGRMHTIPVHWVQYDEVHDDFHISSMKVGGNAYQFNKVGKDLTTKYGSSYYQRGILAFFAGKGDKAFKKSEFEQYFESEKK